jgi:hypothetical protein
MSTKSIFTSGNGGAGKRDLMTGQFALVVAQRDVDQIGRVAPIQARLDVARFQAGHVKQIADQPVEARGAFLDFMGQSVAQRFRRFGSTRRWRRW